MKSESPTPIGARKVALCCSTGARKAVMRELKDRRDERKIYLSYLLSS